MNRAPFGRRGRVSLEEFLAADFARIEARALARCMGIDGKRLYLTGATGFFGKNLLALLAFLRDRGASFEVTALSRDPARFLREHPGWRSRPWLDWREGDAAQPWPADGRYDLLLHAATDTRAQAHVDQGALFEGILAGARRALAFAAGHGVRRMLLCGSGAQYGPIPRTYEEGVPEDAVAACDSTNPGSAYGEGKRIAELLAAIHARKSGCAVVNTRCFAFVGPGLALDGHFAIGNFLRAALDGLPVRLATRGTSVRSYLYGADLAVWLVTLLLDADPGSTVNVGSGQKTTIVELAARVRDLVNPGSPLQVGDDPGATERSFYLPSIDKARTLGLDAWTDLEHAIIRTALWHRLQEQP